jgi:hypothetical protein
MPGVSLGRSGTSVPNVYLIWIAFSCRRRVCNAHLKGLSANFVLTLTNIEIMISLLVN